jgi:hypothetical protein
VRTCVARPAHRSSRNGLLVVDLLNPFAGRCPHAWVGLSVRGLPSSSGTVTRSAELQRPPSKMDRAHSGQREFSKMDPSQEGGAEFTESQRSGIERRQSDQVRTLRAMHALEAALAEAAPRREREWGAGVLDALVALGEVTTQEAENAARPDSLLADIARTQPRLRNRVRGLRIQYGQLRDAIESLRAEIEGSDEAHRTDFADLRQRVAWVLTALRHQRSRESDLIYEAYYEAFKVDLGRDTET